MTLILIVLNIMLCLSVIGAVALGALRAIHLDAVGSGGGHAGGRGPAPAPAT